MDQDINSDLVPNPGVTIPQEGDVTPVDIPQGTSPYTPAEAMFSEEDQDVKTTEEMFNRPEQENYRPMVLAEHRPISSSMIAIAMAHPAERNDLTALNEANLQAARGLLDQQKEYNVRIKVASDRALDTLMHVDRLRQRYQEDAKKGAIIPQNVTDLIEKTYQDVMTRDREQDAQTALEMETVESIRDYMTQGDVHEAYLVRNAAFGNGTAEKAIMEEASKDLIVMQRLEELEAQYQDSGWIRGFVNGVIRFVPFLDSFSAAGILDDAGVPNSSGGLIDFILAGNNLVDQREALYALPLDQFAEAMKADGLVMQSIRDNADWLMNDPARAQQVASVLLAKSQPSATAENVFGIIDAATLGLASSGKVTKLVSGLGARGAASDLSAKAALETISKGPSAAKASTGIGPEELTENLSHSMFMVQDGVPLTSDVVANLKVAEDLRTILPDLVRGQQLSSAEDLQAAIQSVTDTLKKGAHGEHVKDVKVVQVNARTGEVAKAGTEVADDGSTFYRMEVTLGKKEGGGYAKKEYATGMLEKFGREGEVFQAPALGRSGGWYAKTEVDIPLDGFISGKLETPDAILTPFRSSARTADKTAVNKGIVAGNAGNRFLKSLENTLKLAMKGIGRKERRALNEVIKKGSNEKKWYSEDEFVLNYERFHGTAPPQKVIDAYSTFRTSSDVVYLVRNEEVYLKKLNEGYESHNFYMAGREVDVDGKVILDPKKRSLGESMWDASRDRWLADNISSAEIKKMSDEGYVMVKLDEPFEFPDGRTAQTVMVNKGDLTSRPLRKMQLNYSQGGSRAYNATHYIKQSMEDVNGNLLNPKTYIAGRNLNEMKQWADDMNAALDLAKAGETDPLKFADIFRYRPGYPEPEEFLQMIDQKTISKKHRFEVVEDRAMPSAYFNQNKDALRFVDMDETSIESYHRSTGQMYYGTKGEHLKDTTGNFAETIDPWNTLNASITEAAKAYGFSGYKQNMIERFRNTYGNYIETSGVGQANTLYDVAKADIARGTPSDIARKIKQEQSAIARLMNFETEFEKNARQSWRRTADFVLGNAGENSLRFKGRDAMYWLEKNNPIQYMRSLAFDANLGFFNIGQLFIQTSTVASAMALHGGKSIKNLGVVSPMLAYVRSGYSDAVLDVIAKKGLTSSAFKSPEEFKLFARTMRDSNLLEVSGHNLAMINEYGAHKIFGAASKYDAVAEKGRMFFYMAEQVNRSFASKIAWDELIEAGIKPGTTKFKEQFAGLVDDYSFNMMSQSSAAFQHGLPSIPTQFWAYGFRMMDALFGKRFTTAQKIRLALANFTMAGAAGVPGGMVVADLYEKYTGEPTSLENVDGWLRRGLIDGVTYALTDADVTIGQKVGTAEMMTNIFKDLFGVGDYGEKSAWEMFTGASGAKIAAVIPALHDVVYWNMSELIGEGDYSEISQDAWLQLGKEIATFKNVSNSYFAYKYGAFWSKNGTLVENNLPDADTFFFALGFQPGSQSEMSFYFDAGKDQAVEDAAKMLTKWRQDAFTFPDKFEENREKAQALMTLFDPADRKKIRERAYKTMDKDQLSVMQKRFEKDLIESEYFNDMTNLIEEGSNE